MPWDEMRYLIDPDDELEHLHQLIMALDDYGIPTDWDKIS